MDVEEGFRNERRRLLSGNTQSKNRQRILVIVGVPVCVFGVIGVIVGVTSHRTQQFRDHFIDKCEKFEGKKNESCESVYDAFEKAFFGENKKAVTEDDYEGLFKAMPVTYPGDKTMFWSGINKTKTNDLVHRFTKSRDHFFTLEDTLLGHVMDGLTWCGKVSIEEILTDKCSTEEPNPITSFWNKASAKIAQYASGTVTVMLDGERPEPYYNGTSFATQEVTNLQSPKVKKLLVIVVVLTQGDKCNKESLKNLNSTVQIKNIGYDCKEVTQAHIEECIKKKTTGTCW